MPAFVDRDGASEGKVILIFGAARPRTALLDAMAKLCGFRGQGT